jgi:TonB family protein
MLGWNGSAWFSILMSAALKSTVVLGAAWMLALLLRGRSAAARHLVWTAAAAAVLALPLLSVSLPALHVPVSTADLSVNTGVVFRAFGFATADDGAPPATAAAASPGLATPQSAPRLDPRLWILVIWAAGAAASFLKMLVAYGSLWRTRRAARPFEDGGLSARLAHSLEIPHGVAVLETGSGGMPMTFGFLRPSVFMPADSVGWSEERRRIVLLHELAHVRRGDAATHLMARTALALNWWNPLAWIAWREFLKERERATDDLVLSAGARASEYASHLLEVARSMHTTPVSGCAAVAMARRSQLEGRLLAILDSRTNRKPIGAATPALVALLATLLVAPFAAVRAQEQAPQALPPEVDATIRAANAQKNHEILEHAAAAYEKLSKYETAQTLLESALEIRGEVSGQQSAPYAAGLVKLGDLEAKRNRSAEALAFYTKAVSLGDRPEAAPALVYLGMHAYGKRDYDQATDLLQRAINVAPTGPQAGPAMTWMAAVRDAQAGGVASVEPPTRPTQEVQTGVSGSTEPSVKFRSDTVYNTTTQKYDPLTSAEVESLLQKALALEAPDSLDAAVTMELYARFLRGQQRGDEATPLAERAAEIRRSKLAADPTRGVLPAGTNAVRVGGGVTAPIVLSKKDPEYTEVARAAKYQGTALLAVEVGPDGKAYNIRIIRSLGLGLDEKAIEAVKQWRFKPGTKDGQPVTVAATIEVNFRLL